MVTDTIRKRKKMRRNENLFHRREKRPCDEETVRYIQESERDRGVPVVPVDAMLGSFGIEAGSAKNINLRKT